VLKLYLSLEYTHMKVVILAGGYGTRISEESYFKPKPMIEIGNEPILIHLMKYYASYGFNDFIICLGYKGYVIKEYFNNLHLHHSDISFDFSVNGEKTFFNSKTYDWKVTLVDTGLNTMTGGRIKRIKPFIKEDTFLVTYGDGLSDVNLNDLVLFHKNKKTILTLTAVNPDGRFGLLGIKDFLITSFHEKPKTDDGWVNGGFMVVNKDIFNFIENDDTILERTPFEKLASLNQMAAYKHFGFWQPMDTLRDKIFLEEKWKDGSAPWKK
jgi:glucose-1-phosphate cytidylyltransferase